MELTVKQALIAAFLIGLLVGIAGYLIVTGDVLTGGQELAPHLQGGYCKVPEKCADCTAV